MTNYQPPSDGPKATILGKLVIFGFIIACGYSAYRMFVRDRIGGAQSGTSATSTASSSPSSSSPFSFGGGDSPSAEIGIAYGTEKKTWLEWAALEFAKTDAGKKIRIN